ncbi:unnamed protein product [Lampetra fluviatilis]
MEIVHDSPSCTTLAAGSRTQSTSQGSAGQQLNPREEAVARSARGRPAPWTLTDAIRGTTPPGDASLLPAPR